MHNLITDTGKLSYSRFGYRLGAVQLLIFYLLFIGVSGCSTSKKVKSIESSQSSTSKLSLDKDAVRIKGLITSVAKSIGDRYIYEFTVQEIIAYGATFATVEPRLEENISLLAFSRDMAKGSIVIIDVFTPVSRGDGKLVVNMVSE